MYYVDEPVLARSYGYGRVVCSGRDPLVRFPGGLVKRVPGATLRLVSSYEYNEQLANRILINEWTFQYAYGYPLPPDSFADEQRPARPLAERMVAAARYPNIHTARAGVEGGMRQKGRSSRSVADQVKY
jgi:hypothetical protein